MRGRKGEPRFKHGLSKTPEYRAWQNMNDRCGNPNHKAYPNYGGRGISVCPRWTEAFENFLADMGKRPKGMTLDRIDPNGNYCHDNCRWASWREQQNNKRNNRVLTVGGRSLTISQWSAETGLSRPMILWRVTHGWSDEDAVMTAPGCGPNGFGLHRTTATKRESA